MLVLTRKRNQRIVIGRDIELTLLDIRGGRVKIGIDAPADVGVYRQEIRPLTPVAKGAIDRCRKRSRASGECGMPAQ